MIKFKTLFRKGHGSSSSSGGAGGTKNKSLHERQKASGNHFEAAVGAPNSYDSEFEKAIVGGGGVGATQLPKLGLDIGVGSDTFAENATSKMFAAQLETNADAEFETVKRRLECVLNEKCNLEFTLQELVKSHGELETLKKEIEDLKVIFSLAES